MDNHESLFHDDRLEPCPFCGGKHIHHESMHNVRYARCQTCSAAGGQVFSWEQERGIAYSRETVVERWNGRYEHQSIEEINRLAEKLSAAIKETGDLREAITFAIHMPWHEMPQPLGVPSYVCPDDVEIIAAVKELYEKEAAHGL